MLFQHKKCAEKVGLYSSIYGTNVNAPNVGQLAFFTEVIAQLTSFMEGVVCLCGDFNVIMDVAMDRSPPLDPLESGQAPQIASLLKDGGLWDSWRFLFPTVKEFTLYSAPHNIYTRIDCIYVYGNALRMLGDVSVGPIIISDHAPVRAWIHFCPLEERPPLWRLGHNTLNDPLIFSDLRDDIQDYFVENRIDGMAEATVWDAFKAVVRGKIIQASPRLKKALKLAVSEETEEVGRLEKKHKNTGSP